MKINKLAAVGASVALAVGSVVGIGAAAFGVEVPIDEIGQEVPGEAYPAGQWFVGDPAGPELSQDETGLTIPGRNQLLYGQSTTGVTTDAFTALIEGASVEATGTYTFQVPVFFDSEDVDGDGDLLFTTLRPAVPGSPETTTEWTSSRAIVALGVAANTPVAFSLIADVFDVAIDEEASPEILAFGVFVNPGETAVLSSVTWGGEEWTFATPTEPVEPPTEAEIPTPIQDSATFTG